MLKTNILLVDDQQDILELMSDYLEAGGYNIYTSSNSEEALAILKQSLVDIILLDVMMPGEDGFSLCKKIREFSTIPILFLSARDGDIDKIRGLTIGADDYITKSSSPAEVVARVNATSRRQQFNSKRNNDQRGGTSVVHIDHSSMEIYILGKKVDMSINEFRLFSYLYSNIGNVLSYDQILQRVWRDEYYDPQIIRVYITKLRDKLAEYNHILKLKNIRTLGYRLIMVDEDAE
ncbi:response regulator transcription factor [Alkalihalobacillus pseudalcaliphilus]|uniref:response regulator transcription factor n=1 Tax=Alkalihalobacillus pseudalcaliphilus TaxID=79884 RepID=UPI00069D6183|nr:response regulator transcription factor [Alkalihalobacillus pseudalcaliphilus]